MPQEHLEQEEISIVDVWNFFATSGKRILIIGALGALLACAAYTQMGVHQAVIALTNEGGIDFVLFKKMLANLPKIAGQMADENEDDSVIRELSKESWWTKNLKPTYAITKADMKEAGDLKSDSKILSFELSVADNSKELAFEKSEKTLSFLKNASVLSAMYELLQSYTYELETATARIEKSKFEINSEMDYLRKRAASLELLKTKFPQSQSIVNSQVLDPKDSGSKYLPITTQLIAVYGDISMNQESLERLQDTQAQLAVKREVVVSLKVHTKDKFNGSEALNLVKKDIELAMKNASEKVPANAKEMLALKKVYSDLVGVDLAYRVGLSQLSATQYIKKSLALFILVGAMGGLLLGIFYALLLTLKNHYKTDMRG